MKIMAAIAAACLLMTPALSTRGEQSNPQPSGAGRLVFDEQRHQVVLVDTINSAEPANLRTWTWNGEAWQLLPGQGPSRRMVFAAVYDAQRRRIVIFGGATVPATASINETWEIDGATWTRVADSNPPGRDHHSMAYDATRKHVVLFGGQGARPAPEAPRPYLNDTWTWDGKTWRKAAADGPPVRYGQAIAFDQKAGVTVIYGGSTEDVQYADMWKWDGQRWSEIKIAGATPGPRFGASMVYDAARDRTVLFGGRRGDTSTWEWDGRTWRGTR